MEIIDGQIHEPGPILKLDDSISQEMKNLIGVEIAREAIDVIGVTAALVFARQEYNEACYNRYPDRFRGVLVFNHMADDLEDQIAKFKKQPGMLAARNLVGNAMTGELRPEFNEGKFDRYWALCEKYDLPLFCSTHGSASVMSQVAERHPGLTIIIDHFGISQSPVSPPRPEKWDKLPGLLGLAKYPNVNVKWCGGPLVSDSGVFPYDDVWPYLDQILNAFGPERCLWASDYTRMRWVPETMNDHKPRNEWKPYSDCLNYLRDTTRLSQNDKEWILGKTVRKILHWPEGS